MTTAVLYRKEPTGSFDSFTSALVLSEGRPVATNYRFDGVASTYQSIGQGLVIRSVNADTLVSQARGLRRRHFWRLWGLRAPDKQVIEATVSVIRFCPSEFLLDGYHIENYGNGTVVMTKRSPNFMITINIGRSALSYAKLNIKDHKVVISGKKEIESSSVAELFNTL